MERRESVLGDVVFLGFCILFLNSCPSCLVWSGLILELSAGIVVVFMLSYLALRFVAAF